MKSMMMFCNTGKFSSQIGSYGINPFDTNNKDICIEGLGETEGCFNRIDESFKLKYASECVGKQFCTLTGLDTYFNGPLDRCNNDDSIFFLNVQCLQDTEKIEKKRLDSVYII